MTLLFTDISELQQQYIKATKRFTLDRNIDTYTIGTEFDNTSDTAHKR